MQVVLPPMVMAAWGFKDDHAMVPKFIPLNEYGWSKQNFDKWALEQVDQPPNWFGLKFFNVYGPGENHKSRMASVMFHAYHQINSTLQMRLFRSHRKDFEDGLQMRDFIYVKDVVRLCCLFIQKRPKNGLYNIGTGESRTFLDLTRSMFEGLKLEEKISFVDIPEDIRNNYQYYTRASTDKLISALGDYSFYSLGRWNSGLFRLFRKSKDYA